MRTDAARAEGRQELAAQVAVQNERVAGQERQLAEVKEALAASRAETDRQREETFAAQAHIAELTTRIQEERKAAAAE